jgi:alpha-glucoside transport system permease protein
MITSKNSWGAQTLVHLSVLILVIMWTIPTAGLFISSIRDKDQLALSGWWTSLSNSQQNLMHRTEGPDKQTLVDGKYVLKGNVFGTEKVGDISAFGWKSRAPEAFTVGNTAEMNKGQTMTVAANGDYTLSSPTEWTGSRGKRVFYKVTVPPRFTTDNYKEVLNSEGIGKAFINSLTVTIPSTVIPILMAAFAAYALAWMEFPGRFVLVAVVVGLLVVPIQMSLIPLLQLYNTIGTFFGISPKGYLGIWLAHTGFGLPLAIYLLRNYIAGLPKEIIESARVDGANHFTVFTKIILPLSFPALASFAIFQFLWVWNDLLIAMVFLGNGEDEIVLTGRLREMLGSRGGNWEILTASAFITIIVPLCVFFSLQRYLVRGLLAGSVK